MSLTVARPAAMPPEPGAAAPVADANHLRRIVEKQPACLFRVGVDGVILAANDAGLGLLGAQQPSQVLGGVLTTWIMPAHHKAWREFAHAVAAGISQSIECELTDVSGTLRHVDFHGVPLVDHADGIPSLILGARDTTNQRRLEAALHESEVMRENLAAEHHQPMGDTSEIVQALEARIKETEAQRNRLEQTVSKLPQLEQLLKQGKTHLQDLRTKLAAATAERDRLAAQLSAREADNETLWAEQVQLQQSLGEQQQRELAELREQVRDAHTARDEAARQLADYEAGRTLYEATLETIRKELTTVRAELEEAYAERERLARGHQAAVEEQGHALEALQADMQQATAARDSLAAQLSTLEEKLQRSLADQAGLTQLVETHRQETNDLRAQHEEALRAADSHRQQLVTEHEAERARADQALRTAAAQAKEAEKALADHRLELQSMDAAVRQIEPLAAAGRLALDVARDIAAVVADIDARAACLVAECAPDSSSREQIDQLRADSVRVSSLARQILHAAAVNPTEEHS